MAKNEELTRFMKVNTPMRSLLFLLLAFAPVLPVLAETVYVDDILTITLRTGQGTSHRILRSLKSGTSLQVLQRDGDYVRVRTADGIEGWALKQYLTPTPIARERLEQAEQRAERLARENTRLEEELAALHTEKETLSGEHQKTEETMESMRAEMTRLQEVAARPLELEKQNHEISRQLQELELNTRILNEENAVLRDRSNRNWFLTGAGVLFAGMLLGMVVPKMRKKQRWGDL